MRILLAFDKFKTSLSAPEACQAAASALERAWPEAVTEASPIADGGEGFTDTVVMAMRGQWQTAPTHDALGRPQLSRYGIIHHHGEKAAVMEMSAASGFELVHDLPKDPRRASTRGTGEMMQHALASGVRHLLIGIGGSATNDGGMGMAVALGWRFLDAAGDPVTELPQDWARVRRIQPPEIPFPCKISVACDVTNPLLGPHGATRVYGPQKGVDDIPWYEDRLAALADMVVRDLGTSSDARHLPGSGAAGGLGYGLVTFCQAQLQGGFDLVANMTDLEARIAKADLVLTGEGKLDGQSLHGKGPVGVAAMARRLGRPVVGIGGIIEDCAELRQCFHGVIQMKPDDMPVTTAIAQGARLLEEAIAQRVNWLKGIASSSANASI